MEAKTGVAASGSDVIESCVSIDLEVNPKTNAIESFGAVCEAVDEPLVFKRGDLGRALNDLDQFAQEAEFLLGHNIIVFDARHLEAAKADLKLLKKPMIDTLWLNPLAFPKNPYHHLVKHYQDGRLQAGHVNDPVADAQLVLTVLQNQIDAFSEIGKRDPEILRAHHFLTTTGSDHDGFDAVFKEVRGSARLGTGEAEAAIRGMLNKQACIHQVEAVILESKRNGWPLAYALSWISVAGGGSVMAPWVRHQFPEASKLVRRLRDTPCADQHCDWCREQNDPKRLLKRWFGYDGFRKRPASPDGTPLQEAIVTNAMAKTPILGILPTGTGKSVCYQLGEHRWSVSSLR